MLQVVCKRVALVGVITKIVRIVPDLLCEQVTLFYGFPFMPRAFFYPVSCIHEGEVSLTHLREPAGGLFDLFKFPAAPGKTAFR